MFFAKRRLLKTGEPGTATVVSCEYRSKLTSNELRDFDYVLEVSSEAGDAFTAKVRDKFWIAGLRPKEEDEEVPVRFDRVSHRTAFDLKGDPRYDADAMNERTKKLRAETREMRKKLGKDAPPPR
jgi:hypothetical protein